MTDYQPAKLAAMEGLFHTERGAGIVILGQPDMTKQRLDNPIYRPRALSFLTYRRWEAEVKGLDEFPARPVARQHPAALLQLPHHGRAGHALHRRHGAGGACCSGGGGSFEPRWMLWLLMLASPFPFIANTAGWITAELGRQPWIVYGLMRTAHGFSSTVSAGNGLFTLLGFVGMYLRAGHALRVPGLARG